MTATRTRGGQFAKKPTLSPSDQILDDACREVVATIRFGWAVCRTIPISALARRLELAADEAYPDGAADRSAAPAVTRWRPDSGWEPSDG